MNTNQLQNEILRIIRMVFDDKKALEKIHAFLVEEIFEEPEPEEIPEKYKKVVSEIAENLLVGMFCFFNPDTFEVETIPEAFVNDPEEFEMITGETWESDDIKHENWQKCIEIEPMESRDSFKVMEYFVDEVRDNDMQNKLISALNRKKPFANFKYLIENSNYRQAWFDFRQKQYEYYVWSTIQTGIELKL